uniref:RNA/RNP complex-1-interacting phosphatase n=1 Tax=Cynoglossus semilaevis TaxID=244447 RepID=A0A3P8WQZ3_CYNSE
MPKSYQNKGGRGIPDRWLDYKAVGKRLEGTRFIAFKVPLKPSLTYHLRPTDVFGPWELLDAVNEDHGTLGLIIDLTFTSRYYNLRDLPTSLLHEKIFTAGREVPNDATILDFKRAVRRFLRVNKGNDKLIGVHCTHGLNRTGYLICRYLIDVDGMDPKQAVDLFNSSRGHNIEREEYLDDLQNGPKRSNAGMEELKQEPLRGLARQRPGSMSVDDEASLADLSVHTPSPLRGAFCPHQRYSPLLRSVNIELHSIPTDGKLLVQRLSGLDLLLLLLMLLMLLLLLLFLLLVLLHCLPQTLQIRAGAEAGPLRITAQTNLRTSGLGLIRDDITATERTDIITIRPLCHMITPFMIKNILGRI